MEVSGETPKTGSEESHGSETPETSSRAETAAEDFTQDESWNGKITPKKQVE